MSKIGAESQVIMHFSIKLADGSVADSTQNTGKPAKLVMGDGSLTENFEKCLFGLSEGESSSFSLEPEDAFGQPNPDNIHHVNKTQFGGDIPLEEGTIVAFAGPGGQDIPGVITEIIGDSVTVDFNHPLAGQRVVFEVEIISVE
ncbi:FKBP-type peptidyl-prolyl cis-trans isomerase [Veronia pacifica]|uniref:Peptidyl-prolyl cis-trans isomerase n=1 Tax=Veronia pacifica TaxID=1080227 RepID=A0A1C3EK77_9GAMM|nr:FKBP-type peptidyl-prolyl cis-trans isomerase [Veronia pacifica]ODA33641.1 peptidylprolyl isomerase [Veronia pacifica]